MVFLSQPNMTWLYSQVSDTLTISYHLVDASNRYQFNHLCLRSSPLYPQKMLGLNAPNIKLCPLKIIAVTSIKIETSKKNRKCHFQLGKTKNINSCSICFGSDIYIYISPPNTHIHTSFPTMTTKIATPCLLLGNAGVACLREGREGHAKSETAKSLLTSTIRGNYPKMW